MTSTKTNSRRGARSAAPKPFTLDHFRRWARLLVLDSSEANEPEDFQMAVVEDFFAGFREVWTIIPEGNAKTTLMSELALYGADYSPSPWIPVGAASRDQAEILYTQAKGFVERTPGLDKRFRCYDGYRKITSLRNGGVGIKVYAADKGTGDGVIPYPYAFVDEGHRLRDLGLYRTWKGKLRKRGAQIGMISTAGEPGSDFEETRDAIRESASGRDRDGAYLRAEGGGIVLHEWKVPDLAQVRDIAVVKQANPLSTISTRDLAEKLASPTLDFGEDWLRLTCNIPSRSAQAAITDSEWDGAGDGVIPWGEIVDVGLDVAWKWDTTALVPFWLPARDQRVLGDPTILEPPRDGTMLNPHEIEDAFQRIAARNPIRLVVMDREKAEQLASWLEEEMGVEVAMRGKTNEPAAADYERFMEGLRQGWLKHTGHVGLRQHAMNAVVRHLPGDRKRFDRPSLSRRSPREQHRRVIDALDAAAMVHYVSVANIETPSLSPEQYLPVFA